MLSEKVTIVNKLGLHARATAKLVTLAARFSSNLCLKKENMSANAKSMMAVMQLAAPCGTEIMLEAQGEDEAIALKELVELIKNRFGENE